tara:strand:- start:197 stop:325 length:129 start_codon:yes stop_codon:yes gene_type:complete
MIDFKNKKILITGATGGIGGALIKNLFLWAARFLVQEQNLKS